MDARSLDSLTRRFRTGSSRRNALALLAGTLSAPFLRAPLPAAAGGKKVGKKCDKSKDCCDGAKFKSGKNGECICKNTFTKCGKKCYDLDKDHCGSCNTACLDNDFCQDGGCVNVPS